MRLIANEYRSYIVKMILDSVEASTVSDTSYEIIVELTNGYLDQVDKSPMWYDLQSLDNESFAKDLFASLVADFSVYLNDLERRSSAYKAIHQKTYWRLRLAYRELSGLINNIEIRGQLFCSNYDA